MVIVFEGRDAAGKGGTIRRFTENLNPRGARVVALEKPTDREQTEWYLQRYISHLPSAGEIVMFDRSWYNRAGVERVMGFCRPDECTEFLHEAPEFERMLARDGITLIKFWFSVSRSEQLRRFVQRQLDPVKRWKLSPIDLASLDKWDEYTEAKESMFFFTDVADAPWTVVEEQRQEAGQDRGRCGMCLPTGCRPVRGQGRQDRRPSGSADRRAGPAAVRERRARQLAQVPAGTALTSAALTSAGLAWPADGDADAGPIQCEHPRAARGAAAHRRAGP